MDSEPLYCAEQVQSEFAPSSLCYRELHPLRCPPTLAQIKVPDALPEILKEYTKEVIRANPTDIMAWSAK